MTTEVTVGQAAPTQRLTHSLQRSLACKADRDVMAVEVDRLARPGDLKRLLVHVTLLLSGYQTNLPEEALRAEVGYWAKAIADLPEWALEAACRWWRSADNPWRHRRPIEGDIVAHARQEMAFLHVARLRIEEFDGAPAETEIANLQVFR